MDEQEVAQEVAEDHQASPFTRRRRLLVALVLGAILLLGAGGGWIARGDSGKAAEAERRTTAEHRLTEAERRLVSCEQAIDSARHLNDLWVESTENLTNGLIAAAVQDTFGINRATQDVEELTQRVESVGARFRAAADTCER